MDFLNDQQIMDWVSTHTILIEHLSAFLAGLLKILAIRSPKVPSNKIIDLLGVAFKRVK